jgi:hypothetical protein
MQLPARDGRLASSYVGKIGRRNRMSETFRALVDMEIYGFVEEDKQNLHEVVLYGGETFDIELEAEEEEVTLDLFVTDEDDNIVYQAGAPAEELFATLTPTTDAVYRIFVKAVSGESDYVLALSERD